MYGESFLQLINLQEISKMFQKQYLRYFSETIYSIVRNDIDFEKRYLVCNEVSLYYLTRWPPLQSMSTITFPQFWHAVPLSSVYSGIFDSHAIYLQDHGVSLFLARYHI